MKKIKKIYLQIFSIILLLTFFWIFLITSCVIGQQHLISIGLMAFFCFLIFVFGKKCYNRITEQKIVIIYWILWRISCLLMLYIAWSLRMSIYHTWDYGRLLQDAIQLAQTNEFKSYIYYSQYPNNLFMLFLLKMLFKTVLIVFPDISIGGLQASSIIVSCILVQISIVLVYMTAKEVWGKKKAAVTGVFLLLASPLYLYATLAYTDTFSLPLVVGQIYFYVKFQKEETKKKWYYLVGIAILGAMGFKLKMTIAFVLIASIINLFIRQELKQFLKYVGIILVVSGVTCIIINKTLSFQFNITPELSNRYQFPYAHWVMMTLNDSGGYSQEDVDYTCSFETYDEKNKADIKEIKHRLKQRGMVGTLKHIFVKKIIRTWGNASMAGDTYISSVAGKMLTKTKLHSLFCLDGKYHDIYMIYSQAYHLIMLFWIFYCAIINVWKRQMENGMENVLMTTVWGLAVFLSIWECNSRYIFQMLPIMVLLMMSGMYKSQWIYNRKFEI